MPSLIRSSFFILLVALFAQAGQAQAGEAGTAGGAKPSSDGFTTLFNGKDWDGWHLKVKSGNADLATKVFAIENGTVHIFNDAFPAEYELGGSNATHGMCYTNKAYSRYVFRFEYKWGKRIANNFKQWQYDAGCYYHVFNEKIWPSGIEYQVRFDHLKNKNHTGDLIKAGVKYDWIAKGEGITATYLSAKDGGIPFAGKSWYNLATPTERYHGLDDQWNQCELIVMGKDYAIHKLNGQVVNMATNLSVGEGTIGLQAETAEIFYRNIAIKEFDQSLPAETFLAP